MISDPHAKGEVLHSGAPLGQAALAVILLHGRGASAADILSLGKAFGVPGVAYLAPQAAGHSWYPQSFLASRDQNEPYLASALTKVGTLVRTIEEAGVPTNRIVIGGFSQGACLSTEFIKSYPAPYAGLIAFTGGLIGPPGSIQTPESFDGKELKDVSALLLSGDPDPHVPWSRVEESAAVFRAMGADVTTQRLPGRPHTVTQEEISLGAALLHKALRW